MEEKKKGEIEMEESFPMTGGDGPNCYSKNSNAQKEAADLAKAILVEAIIENIEVEETASISSTFHIADLGCSTGPNTFFAVKTIIEAVTQKYEIKGRHGSLQPEFQVHFNDHVSNDFNSLFNNLPPDRQYLVSGVPGSFYNRLFPKASLHFVYSAYALQWLSRVPAEVGDLESAVCNRGRIFYSNAPNEVGKAYAAQYAMDMECFLAARAEEVAPGGLMAILIPGRPDGTLPEESSLGPVFQLLEYCLVDMVIEGKISKEKIDSFNLPIYSPSPEELRTLIQNNGCFSIVKLEITNTAGNLKQLPTGSECRSGLENIIIRHFGTEILEELFERYTKKIVEGSPLQIGDRIGTGLCIILKRNH